MSESSGGTSWFREKVPTALLTDAAGTVDRAKRVPVHVEDEMLQR